MKTFDDLYKEKEDAKTVLKNIEKEINEKLSRTIVQCTKNNLGKGCGMASTIADLEYIQTYWYESPHGCMAGDKWHQGEGQFDCPHCGHRNRLSDRKDIEKLKYLFGGIKKEYEQ